MSRSQLRSNRRRHAAFWAMLGTVLLCGGCAAPDPLAHGDDAGPSGLPADAGSTDGGTADAGPDGGPDAGVTGNCVDDSREENDSPESGTATEVLTHSVGGSIELPGQVACPGDDDFIRGYADCCPGFGVTVRWNPPSADLEVELLSAAGAAISLDGANDQNVRDAGYIHLLEMDEGGEFLVRIRSATRVEYDATLYAPLYGP